jgi:hypothetical protein
MVVVTCSWRLRRARTKREMRRLGDSVKFIELTELKAKEE